MQSLWPGAFYRLSDVACRSIIEGQSESLAFLRQSSVSRCVNRHTARCTRVPDKEAPHLFVRLDLIAQIGSGAGFYRMRDVLLAGESNVCVSFSTGFREGSRLTISREKWKCTSELQIHRTCW